MIAAHQTSAPISSGAAAAVKGATRIRQTYAAFIPLGSVGGDLRELVAELTHTCNRSWSKREIVTDRVTRRPQGWEPAYGLEVGWGPRQKTLVTFRPCVVMTDISIEGPGRGTQRRLLMAAQQGDRTAMERLLQSYERLVWRVVWNMRPPIGCEREDLAQEARIGLLAAVRAWRPERGAFPAFADQCVRNRAVLAVQVASRRKHQMLTHALSLEGLATAVKDVTADSFEVDLLNTLAATDPDSDPVARVLGGERLTILLRALPTLTPSERDALRGTLSGETYEQLARARGCTPKAAEHAAYRARKRLAAALDGAA
jgi:RNA polymerase sigma factor (sigma-70 family)